MIQKFKALGRYIGVTLLLLFFLGFYIRVDPHLIPDNATVFVDDDERTYYSPACLSLEDTYILRLVTIRQARNLDYDSDRNCRNQGGFVLGTDRSLTFSILESLGFWYPLPNRWNKDGSWNW